MKYADYPKLFKEVILPGLNFDGLLERKNELEPHRYDAVEEEIYEAICQRIDEKVEHYRRLFELAENAGIQVIIHIKSRLN